MSMISAQIDELRELATRYDELQVGAVKAVTMPSDMGSILRDAADTIWQLRDDLQRANAENDRLREERDTYRDLVGMMDHPDINVQLQAENAKLRELIEAIMQCAGETKRDKGCDACPMYNGPWRADGTWCLLRPTLHELGMEVDG